MSEGITRKVISEGYAWQVERIGPGEFVNFPGSFAEWVIQELDDDA